MLDLARLDQLQNASVLVIGDVMLDRYFIGDTNRISPEAPVPVVRVAHTEDRAGGAANVARNIAHLDGQAAILGIIGKDRKRTRLNSSHVRISYAVFCLKKKKKKR